MCPPLNFLQNRNQWKGLRIYVPNPMNGVKLLHAPQIRTWKKTWTTGVHDIFTIKEQKTLKKGENGSSKGAKGPLDSRVQDIFTKKEQKVPKKGANE